jgi:hypothetical protein
MTHQRNFEDWISAYLRYASITEAPKRMHFWSAVGTIAGALRRRVWFDMGRFCWYPSFYIIFVGPPGIVAKSTTIDISTYLLREVPGIKFGPDTITWQALVSAFADASEEFEFGGEFIPMSPLTLVSSELGSLLDLRDGAMINLLIELWDGKRSYEKKTKMSGNDAISAPYINLQAGTTPDWISRNMPQSMIGGGLSSRMLFVYGDLKERYIAYPKKGLDVELDKRLQSQLIADLESISYMVGPFEMDADAETWGEDWYERFWKSASNRANDPMMAGYGARKQTHMHKVAMVLSAARGNSMRITLEDLQLANTMLEDLERDMPKVFSKIGRTDDSLQAERFIEYIQQKGEVSYPEAYRMIHVYFPDFHNFEGIVQGAIQSGQIRMISTAQGIVLASAAGKKNPPLITPDTEIK